MLNDEATVVAGLLVGLNIIDCNMVLKDDDDLDRPVHVASHVLYISYSCLISVLLLTYLMQCGLLETK